MGKQKQEQRKEKDSLLSQWDTVPLNIGATKSIHSPRIPLTVLVATRDIQVGEELFSSYVYC